MVSASSHQKTPMYFGCSVMTSSSCKCSLRRDASAMTSLDSVSHQVDEREDQDPHQIDEVPVEPGGLDRSVVRARVLAAQPVHENHTEITHATEYVAAVEARGHEER